MNNSLDRILEGIAASIRHDVIPRLTDEYASGQALAVIDLINNLRPRVDWAVGPLRARISAQKKLLATLDILLTGREGMQRFPENIQSLPLEGKELQELGNRLDAFIGSTIRWLGTEPDSGAAQSAIMDYLHAELRRDMALTPRPLFAEIARGADTVKSDPGRQD